jgi:hypothetical protein
LGRSADGSPLPESKDPPIEFDGLDPWPRGEPVVECRRGRSRYDLHNWSRFVGWQWRSDRPLLLLAFLYDPDRWGGGTSRRGSLPLLLHLGFDEVRGLTVVSPSDLAEREHDLVEEWVWEDDGDDGSFEFQLGRMQIEFRARRVRFTTSAPAVD